MDTAPYPPEDGTWLRRIPFPVARPIRRPRAMTAERKTGGTCDVLATLGARPPARQSPDEAVRDWTPFP